MGIRCLIQRLLPAVQPNLSKNLHDKGGFSAKLRPTSDNESSVIVGAISAVATVTK